MVSLHCPTLLSLLSSISTTLSTSPSLPQFTSPPLFYSTTLYFTSTLSLYLTLLHLPLHPHLSLFLHLTLLHFTSPSRSLPYSTSLYLSISHSIRAMATISNQDISSLPHLTRWSRHINSFSPQEIAQW